MEFKEMKDRLDEEPEREQPFGRNLADFEKIRDNLTVRMVNREQNQEYLRGSVSIPVLDLAAVFYLTDSLSSMNLGIRVTEELWERWNVSIDEMLETVQHNLRQNGGFRLYQLREMLSDYTGIPLDGKEVDSPELYVLTDASRKNGPSVLLLPEELKTTAEAFRDDLLLLPSSVYEMIVLRADRSDSRELQKIVSEINRSVVSEEDVLGDHVYRYCRDRSEVIIEC